MKIQGILSKLIIIVFFLLFFQSSLVDMYAQTTDTTRFKIEKGWIEKMSNKIAADISFNNSYKILEVRTPENKILLYPNTPNNVRFNINYDFISFGIQFAPEFLPGNGDNKIRGSTNSFHLGTALIFRHWFADISYTKVKGYYLKNTADYTTWVNGDPYIQFPDLHHEGFSISTGYINNSKFSLCSLTSQTERQLKSAGSFIPVFNFEFYVIDDKSSPINTQKSKNIEANIGPGYAYTFVLKEKLYLALNLNTSLGYLNTKLTTRTSDGNVITDQDNFIFRWDAKSGIGYNSNNFYTGLYASISGSQYKQENTAAINSETRFFYRLFLGMRFKSPQFLESLVTKVKNIWE